MGTQNTLRPETDARSLTDDQLVIAAFTELAPTYEQTVDRELRMFWGVPYRDFLARFLAVRVFGLDITPAMLVQAAARLAVEGWTQRTPLVCGSALAMPLADASFDVALCALGTHHMDVPVLVAEMHRVVRPGGRIVLADVCANNFWRSLAGAALLRVHGWLWVVAAQRARSGRNRSLRQRAHT